MFDIKNYKDFNNYLIIEKLGINEEVLKISNIIYDDILIKNSYKNYQIKLPINKLGIEYVFIFFKNHDNNKASFDIGRSNRNKIYLWISKDIKLTVDTIYHELNHAIKFIFVGKENSKKKLFDIKSLRLVKPYIASEHDNIINTLIMFKYYSSREEIDSYLYNSYYQLINPSPDSIFYNFDKFYTDNFNEFFDLLIRETESYSIFKFISNYNPNDLKKINHTDLQLYLNIVEDNYNFLLKQKRDIYSILRAVYQIIFKKHFISTLDIKIVNIDKYIDKLQKEKDESSKYLIKKLYKLYDLIKTERILQKMEK